MHLLSSAINGAVFASAAVTAQQLGTAGSTATVQQLNVIKPANGDGLASVTVSLVDSNNKPITCSANGNPIQNGQLYGCQGGSGTYTFKVVPTDSVAAESADPYIAFIFYLDDQSGQTTQATTQFALQQISIDPVKYSLKTTDSNTNSNTNSNGVPITFLPLTQ